jgi:hypothetical protein
MRTGWEVDRERNSTGYCFGMNEKPKLIGWLYINIISANVEHKVKNAL